ncbi:MAG: helix-turn-helix domain-containing protein [Ferruginibacter sp.]
MSTKYRNQEWVTQAEAARIRGISRQAINKLVKRGKIQTFEVSSVTFVNREEIQKYKPKKSGRPKNNKNG